MGRSSVDGFKFNLVNVPLGVQIPHRTGVLQYLIGVLQRPGMLIPQFGGDHLEVLSKKAKDPTGLCCDGINVAVQADLCTMVMPRYFDKITVLFTMSHGSQ